MATALAVAFAVVAAAVSGMVWGVTGAPPAGLAASPPASSAGGDGYAARVERFVVDVTAVTADRSTQTAGTGIVLTSDGLVLTNNHVIDQAASLAVSDAGNGRTYPATVAGYDVADDLAVLRLQGASGLATAAIGSSAQLQVGQVVTAFGNAQGAGGVPSMAIGTVVALDTSIVATDEVSASSETLTGLIETTVGLESGYSGGPLVDTSGRVVGVNTAAAATFRLDQPSTVSFAVPIDRAMSVFAQVRSGRSTESVHVGPSAFLGVRVGSSPAAAGVVVLDVTAGSPADRAGISSGDVITAFAGHRPWISTDLGDAVRALSPGTKVTVEWVDLTGVPRRATVTLGSGPPA